MYWIYLLMAGIFEIGWPLGFKLASTMPKYHFQFILLSIISMAISGYLLFMAQKGIPIGTAYAVWTGIGAIGTLTIGIVFFHDSASVWRLCSAFLIITGIVGLKLAH